MWGAAQAGGSGPPRPWCGPRGPWARPRRPARRRGAIALVTELGWSQALSARSPAITGRAASGGASSWAAFTTASTPGATGAAHRPAGAGRGEAPRSGAAPTAKPNAPRRPAPAYQAFVRDMIGRSASSPAFHVEIRRRTRCRRSVLPGYPGRPARLLPLRGFGASHLRRERWRQLASIWMGGRSRPVLDFGGLGTADRRCSRNQDLYVVAGRREPRRPFGRHAAAGGRRPGPGGGPLSGWALEPRRASGSSR